MEEDALVFIDEGVPAAYTSVYEPWKILIVDDDKDVHDATLFALRGAHILGRPLEFFHAFSGAEAVNVLKQHDDVGLILLDAVMETETAGLDTVRIIREDLQLENVRIILRTGQPGQVPELETIEHFDINDYKTKSELTRTKLLTSVITAFRSWQQLGRIEKSRRGLEKIVAAGNQFIMAHGLQTFAEGVITQMAGLFSLEPEGIVCVSDEGTGKGDGKGQYIIAAAGAYSHHINKTIDEIDRKEIVESVTASLREKRNIISPHSLTVYFSGKNGRSYATWIGSAIRLKEIDTHLLEVFCSNLSLSANNIDLVERLKMQALFDPFLDIPNLSSLLEKLNGVIESGDTEGSRLILLDIDGFSEINEMLGHQYGDEVLRGFTALIIKTFSANAFYARISSDVFAVVCVKDSMCLTRYDILSHPVIKVFDESRELSVSVSVTEIDPSEGDASAQLANGYIALKHAKTEGTGRIIEYNGDIGQATRERVRLLHALKGAFAENKLFLVFQPQAQLQTMSVFGVEALLRWRNAEGDFIPPEQFIPLAEQGGLMNALGCWVMRTALFALAQLHHDGFPHLKMAVNVSALQLRGASFLKDLDSALADSHVDPSFLEIEITESVAILGIEGILPLLEQIRARNISLAIDDFGTGFSSLSSIDKWPISRIKIDRSFIQQIDVREKGARIVDLVIPLGKQLDVKVIAEGVETDVQAERLAVLGCDEIQGYLLARPMRLNELKSWLLSYQLSEENKEKKEAVHESEQ